MGENSTCTILDLENIKISDICGFWEVLRICDGKGKASYPWLSGRFKFNFLEEMMFLILKEGQCHHGNWKLSEKYFETKKLFSIILNSTFEYTIIDISEDELIMSDRSCEYLLVRRL